MFILPPPPPKSANSYYPGALGYRDGVPIEATNSVTQLDGNSIQTFTAPEGLYCPRECVYLATPLPHPSDPPPAVINPLAPTHTLPSTHSSGMRLATCTLQESTEKTVVSTSLRPKQKSTRQLSNASTSSGNKGFGGWNMFKNKTNEEEPSMAIPHSSSSEEVLSTSAPLPSSFGNPLTRKDTTLSVNAATINSINEKKKKPKNSLSKNNSSFISRTVIHDNLHKRLAERQPHETFFFANVGRSISWVDLAMASKSCRQEPLIKILFTKSHPLCQDVNMATKSTTNLDVIIGTSAGDVIWVECVSSRYNRLNKNGDVTRSAVTDVRWIPGSESLFMTAHADGSICIFDKDRDDGGFASQGLGKQQDPSSTDVFRVIKSLNSPPLTAPTNKQNTVGPAVNPVAVYKVSNGPITSLKFSPATQMLAITNKDGYLRLLNLASEQLTDIFPSYYGGFTCACWSPDGKYLATGGQDDMVCIWAIGESKKSLVVRLQGHASWIRAVKFDPYTSDGVNYRLGSVGDDGKLLLWDFTPKSLNRPKMMHHNSNRARASSTSAPVAKPSSEEQEQADHPAGSTKTVLHPFVSQGETPILPPIVSKQVHLEGQQGESLCDLSFKEHEVVVAGRDGRVWVWERPAKNL